MHTRMFACFAGAVALSSVASAGMTEQPTGGVEADLFVLPPILLTNDTVNDVRVIHQSGSIGGDGTPGGGGGGGMGGSGNTDPVPSNPRRFGQRTDFQGEVTNGFGRTTSFMTIEIIPFPEHEYAPGEFESLRFDSTEGIEISDLGAQEGEFDFTATFTRDDTRIVIEFAQGSEFDPSDVFAFGFTVENDAESDLPLGFRYTVPTPGTAMLTVLAGAFAIRRKR